MQGYINEIALKHSDLEFVSKLGAGAFATVN